jgi:ABC-2 type transport system ATP-binding protein
MEVAVEISELTKSYGALKALDRVSLSIGKGSMVSIVGPDGAGKTTLIKLLCGILDPDHGSMKILGLDVHGDYEKVKKHIGYLSQTFTLYADLSVDENLEFFAEIHQVGNYRKRRDELLAFTRLTPFRERLADRLSGGMKQKLALACTLIHSPEVIFLDEPTTGVDPVSRREFWIILAGLLRKGITVVMTTPYMDEAERSSLVGMLFGGRLILSGSPEYLRGLFPGTIIEAVVDDVRRAGRIIKTRRAYASVELFGDRLHVAGELSAGNIGEIKKILENAGITIKNIRTVAPSLENVFISFIKKEVSMKESTQESAQERIRV